MIQLYRINTEYYLIKQVKYYTTNISDFCKSQLTKDKRIRKPDVDFTIHKIMCGGYPIELKFTGTKKL